MDGGNAGVILVIEPDAQQRTAIAEALKAAGFKAMPGEDAGDALSTIAVTFNEMLEPIDMIIVNKDLPDMDGLKFVIELRKRRFVRHMPVLMLAQEGQKVQSAIMIGVDEAMYKPVEFRRLVHVCRCLLAVRNHLNPIVRREEYQRLLSRPYAGMRKRFE